MPSRSGLAGSDYHDYEPERCCLSALRKVDSELRLGLVIISDRWELKLYQLAVSSAICPFELLIFEPARTCLFKSFEPASICFIPIFLILLESKTWIKLLGSVQFVGASACWQLVTRSWLILFALETETHLPNFQLFIDALRIIGMAFDQAEKELDSALRELKTCTMATMETVGIRCARRVDTTILKQGLARLKGNVVHLLLFFVRFPKIICFFIYATLSGCMQAQFLSSLRAKIVSAYLCR